MIRDKSVVGLVRFTFRKSNCVFSRCKGLVMMTLGEVIRGQMFVPISRITMSVTATHWQSDVGALCCNSHFMLWHFHGSSGFTKWQSTLGKSLKKI